jgi:hypothetical protein
MHSALRWIISGGGGGGHTSVDGACPTKYPANPVQKIHTKKKISSRTVRNVLPPPFLPLRFEGVGEAFDALPFPVCTGKRDVLLIAYFKPQVLWGSKFTQVK